MTTRDSPVYAIAIGSNRYGPHGAPANTVRVAMTAIGGVLSASRIIASAPLGPSSRRFANAVILVDSNETPPQMLTRLKAIERAFGRRRGRRWGARVIDLDIVLWSGGIWRSAGLSIPHVGLTQRRFVLDPLATLAPGWRDPLSRLTVRQLAARARAVDRARCRP